MSYPKSRQNQRHEALPVTGKTPFENKVEEQRIVPPNFGQHLRLGVRQKMLCYKSAQ